MARQKYGKLIVDLSDLSSGDEITNKPLLEWLKPILEIPLSGIEPRKNVFKTLKELILLVTIDDCLVKISMNGINDDVSGIFGSVFAYEREYYARIDIDADEPTLTLNIIEFVQA